MGSTPETKNLIKSPPAGTKNVYGGEKWRPRRRYAQRAPSTLQAQSSSPRTALPAANDPETKPLSTREQTLLQRIRSQATKEWRTYGSCHYNWANWKLVSNGVRTTSVDCGDESKRWIVAVDCKAFKVNMFVNEGGWQGWKKPAGEGSSERAGEDSMVAALCANIPGSK